MSRNLNGKQPLPEDVDNPYVEEEEAAALDLAAALGLMLPPDPDELLDIGEVHAKNWRDYGDIATNSLWVIGPRSREGVHTGKYHGNFVPQIPYQAIRRFTKPGDIVLDTFLGSGTSLIESRRLGRHGVGIELIDSIAREATSLINTAENPHHTWQEVIQGDSTSEETINKVRETLAAQGRNQAQLLIMHPPYHDIIKFSEDPRDLCNAQTVTEFLETFQKIVYRTYDLLEQNRFLVVIIGDKYSNSEWVPLGFRTMEAVQSVGYTLKSIVVKNMEGNRAKRNQQNLWRQRAFRGNYYIFKHEYVFFFQKTGGIVEHLRKVTEFVKQLDAREDLNLIQKSSFSSGESLGELMAGYSWILPPRVLTLKKGQVRAVVVNLTGLDAYNAESELEDFIRKLPPSVVDVSIIAERDHKVVLQDIPGVSQVYSPNEESLELLAHALYNIRKAIGFGQRVGRAAAVAFAQKFNKALANYFDAATNYEWRRRGEGIGFKFFRRDSDKPFDATINGLQNFHIGIETKWVSGHENEKAPQIRSNFYRKGFELVAVVGHNIEKWRSFIEKRNNFADYYLFLGKEDENLLEEIVLTRPLFKACGDKSFEETTVSLIDFLKRKSPNVETLISEDTNASAHLQC